MISLSEIVVPISGTALPAARSGPVSRPTATRATSSPATSGNTVLSLPQGRRIAPCAGRLWRTSEARFS